MLIELKVPEDLWPRRRDWSGEIVSLQVKEGDIIKEGDLVAEVEIEKVVIRLESVVSGKITKVLVKEGEKVRPGDIIAIIEVKG